MTKTEAIMGLSKSEAGYVEAIKEGVKEMALNRKAIKKLDAEIRRLRDQAKRQRSENLTILSRVEATL